MQDSVHLSARGGRLRAVGWPLTLPLPFGLARASDGTVEGPGRLRRAARSALAGRVAYVDEAGPPPVRLTASPPREPAIEAMVRSWLRTGTGVLAGLPLGERTGLVPFVASVLSAPALVVVPDTGAVAAWLRHLEPWFGARVGEARRSGERPAVALATLPFAARESDWIAQRAELLVVDGLEHGPLSQLRAVVDASVALSRLGLCARGDRADLPERCAGLGPVLADLDADPSALRVELRLPLEPPERERHDEAWSAFLSAFDRFAALRPSASFGEFVRTARTDVVLRPGLLAWHRAARAASFSVAKRACLDELLARHRGERVLVFTPDRESAYEVAARHAIAPVTAELPRAERDRALREFAAGRLRALVGPRLLETGVDEGAADVGIALAAPLSRAQRDARLARVRRGGRCYELTSQETAEVSRVARLARRLEPSIAPLH